MSNPVMTMRYLIDGEEQPDSVQVLWTGMTGDDGYYASLMSHPGLNYVILRHEEPFADGQALDLDDLGEAISLGRPDAGQLALALITALINNSDHLIDHYIVERMRSMSSAGQG